MFSLVPASVCSTSEEVLQETVELSEEVLQETVELSEEVLQEAVELSEEVLQETVELFLPSGLIFCQCTRLLLAAKYIYNK